MFKKWDKETIENLFEPLTTKKLDEATGICRSTVSEIVKQNNEFVNVYSEKEEKYWMKKIFDPFNSRACRNIRNQLTLGLVQSIEKTDMKPVRKVAARLMAETPAPCQSDYIRDRLSRYERVISSIKKRQISATKTYAVGALLWESNLFFECHEWLEQIWTRVQGSEKKILQALIRSAGTFELSAYGRDKGARSTASKALPILCMHRDLVPLAFDVETVITRLKTIQ